MKQWVQAAKHQSVCMWRRYNKVHDQKLSSFHVVFMVLACVDHVCQDFDEVMSLQWRMSQAEGSKRCWTVTEWRSRVSWIIVQNTTSHHDLLITFILDFTICCKAQMDFMLHSSSSFKVFFQRKCDGSGAETWSIFEVSVQSMKYVSCRAGWEIRHKQYVLRIVQKTRYKQRREIFTKQAALLRGFSRWSCSSIDV